MSGSGVATRIGVAGYVASVLLVLGAVAVVVAEQHESAEITWDGSLVVADGDVDALGPVDDDGVRASHQQRLSIGLATPVDVMVGDRIQVGIELSNTTEDAIPLDPCPTYRLAFTPVVGRIGPTDAPDEALAEVLGRLRCSGAGELRPGEQVRFEVPFELDGLFTAPQTLGTISFELWPGVDIFRPVGLVPGVVVNQRTDGPPFGELPPGGFQPGGPGFPEGFPEELTITTAPR